MQRRVITTVLVFSALSVHAIAYGDIFQCVDAEGNILLTDSPCPKGSAMTLAAPSSPEPEAEVQPEEAVQRTYSQQELDQLLAPIALYPDALLAQVLMAATYPLEVVQASRWLKAHPALKGDALQAALLEESWDPSVKGLVTVPQVLTMMDERLDWTQKLGDAFLEQGDAVMDTVQRLRGRAQGAGNLTSTPQQTVTTEGGTIRIEETNPQVFYVPVYNPTLVYGPWWWPAPPYYWYPPGYVVTGPAIYFGVGLAVGHAIWGDCDWYRRNVTRNVHRYNDFNRAHVEDPHWHHDVEHRKGVPYQDEVTRREFGREIPGAVARHDFRGYPPVSSYRSAPRPPSVQPRAPAAPTTRPLAPVPLGKRPPGPAPGTPHPPIEGAHEPRMRAQGPAPVSGLRPPPAFDTFGRGDAARTYGDRGAESRANIPLIAPRIGTPHPAPGLSAPRPAPARR